MLILLTLGLLLLLFSLLVLLALGLLLLLFRLSLLLLFRGLSLLFMLLLLCVSWRNSSEKKKQNSRADNDKSNLFHECCLHRGDFMRPSFVTSGAVIASVIGLR